ncbi:DUF7507 domain-containing protein [Algoriphagus confluentis]|uniref:DUF7507 domain-containing protein n=1 Tax=Algoriphagus confluentis TaxID=1697556 RepID=UPI0030C782EB
MYTFENVVTLPGNTVVHAIITIEDETRGDIALFDNTSDGYPSALQPSFRSGSFSSGLGFGIFDFQFVTGTYNSTTGQITNQNPIQIPAFNAYLVDIDGISAVSEFQAVTGGGTVTFGQGAASNITAISDDATFITRYQDNTGSSADGIPINVFDRMVRVEFTNVQNFKWKFGVNYRSTQGNTRLFSFYVLCIPGFVPADGDYSDAPASYGSPNHAVPNSTNVNSLPRLGNIVDREPGALPSVDANGDDISSADLSNPPTGTGPGVVNDEDGVTIPAGAFNAGDSKQITINIRQANNTSQKAYVNAWIDWNRDGDFLDQGERVIINQGLTTGNNGNITPTISVPCDAVPGISYLRVRVSTTQDLPPIGGALNGEVEDYKITITDTNNLTPVSITTQPQGAIYCQNTPADNVANLSVAATGSFNNPNPGSLTYQWYSNTTNSNNIATATLIPDATSSTYKPSTSVVGEVYYFVVVTGNCKPATSNTAKITVNALPANPVITPIPPTCEVATGGFTFDRISGVEYSLSSNFSSIIPAPGNSVTGLAAGSSGFLYARTIGTTCVSFSPYSVAAQPQAPAAPVITPIAPTCEVATGGFTFNRISGVEYSLSSNFSSIIPAPGNSVIGLEAGSSGFLYARTIGTTCVSFSPYSVAAQPQIPAAPNSGGNQVVCATDPIQTLTASATAPQGFQVRWFDAATGGNAVPNPTWNTIGTKIYYAESFNPTTGCFSATRTPVTLTINNCAISLLKTGELSTEQIGGCPRAGDEIVYTFVVTNTGDANLTNISLMDVASSFTGNGAFPSIQFVEATPGSTATELLVNGSSTFTATYTLLQSDIDDAGFIENQAKVTALAGTTPLEALSGAEYVSETFETDGEKTIVEYCREFNYSVEKNWIPAQGQTSISSPGVINYEVVITNIGNTTITGIEAEDTFPDGSVANLTGVVESILPANGKLDVGETWTYQFTYNVIQTDIDNAAALNPSQLVNRVEVTSDQLPDPAPAEAVTPVSGVPSLMIEKVADQSSYASEGDVLTYEITVTNNGNVTLTNIVVSDPQATITGGSPIASLAPGASAVVTAEYEVQQADVDNGSFTNTATASTTYNEEEIEVSDDETVNAAQRPSLMIEKVADQSSYASEGDVLTYEITVTNNGNVTLTNIVVSDPQATITGGSPIASLAPGASAVVTAEYEVQQADVDNGSFTNTATASTTYNEEEIEVSDDETVNAAQRPSLMIEKVRTSNNDIVNGQVTFDITVTNTGNVTLFDIYVQDIETGDNWIINELAPGDTDTREVLVTITQEMIDDKCYFNTATAEIREYFIDARVVPGQGEQLPYQVILRDEAFADACFTQTPELSILKEITGGDPYSLVGDEVDYKYTLTNTGNVTLSGPFTVGDDKIGTIDDANSTLELKPGDQIVFTASYTINENDLEEGSVTNVAIGKGFFTDGEVEEPIESDPDTETADASFNDILAVDDNAGTFQYSTSAQIAAINALDNDQLKGGPATSANVILTTLTPDPTGTLTVDANGVITIAANPQAGDYQLTYRITEVGNPLNFDEAIITVTVDPLLGVIEVGEYCELDAPYLRWLLNPVNFQLADLAPGDDTPLTMTWYDKDGNPLIVYEDIPLEGFMLFPGADTIPGGFGSAWPGWKFENMQWVSGEFNFHQVREAGAYVIFELNPSVQVEISYPGATEACNPNPNPPIAVDDDMTAIPVYPDFGFINIVNVLDNDRLQDGTSPLNTTLVTVTEVTQSTPGALILDTNTGLVSVAPGLAPGIYTLEYRICTNPNPTNCDTAIVTVRVVSPGISIEKSVTEIDNDVEGFITYEIKVTNTGDVELFNIEVKDDLTGDMWTIQSLAPQEVWTETTQLEITQELLDGLCVTNTAIATVYADEFEYYETFRVLDGERRILVRDEDSIEECFEINPAIELLKDGVFMDENQDGFGNVGETVTYTFTVTNTGNVTLSDITVTDPLVTVNGGPISLAPGASDNTTFTATYVLTQEDIDNGYVVNTALAKGTAPNEEEVEDESSDPTPVENPSTECESCTETVIPQNPAIELLKDGVFMDENQDGFGNVGETVTYTFTVTNTGNVTLSDITVTDPLVTVNGGPISLAPGASDNTTFTATYVLTQEDIDNGYVVNTALAKGTSPKGVEVEDESSDPTPVENPSTECETCTETVIPQNPAIELLKDGVFMDENQDGFGNVGETVTYTFKVTNTGNVTLSNITVTDPLVTVNGGPISLAPGASDNTTFTATYVLTQEDIDNGYVVNTALAKGTSPKGVEVEDESSDPTPVENPSTECETCTETVIPQNPAIELLKDGVFMDENQDGFGNVGETVTYTFTVTNTGNVTLSDITVTDPLVTVNGGPISLAPGASDNTTFTATYVLTQEDIDNGYVVNTALAKGTSPNGVEVEDESSDPTPVENSSTECETCTETVIPQNPAIQVVKSDNGAQVDGAGDVITYTLTVTNTGNVTLTNVTIEDPLTGLDVNVGTLSPGVSTSVNTEYVVTQADVDAGFVVNTALTKGESPDGEDPEDDTEIETPVDRNPAIQIIKSDNGAQVDGAGDVITYTLTVTNTGNVTLTNVIIEDPLTGLDFNVGTLAPAASTSVNTEYVVTLADVNAGVVLNTALTKGESPDGEDPEDETEIETPVDRNASIQVVKSDNGAQVNSAGDVITYTLTVTNTGNVILTNVTIEDPLTGLDVNVGSLAPGASTSVNTEYVVTQADVDAGLVVNTALTKGESPDGDDPEDETDIETPIDRTPSIQITKSDNGALVEGEGDTITYTLTVTNTGNVTLSNVLVTDPLTGLDVNVGTLAPGASTSVDTEYVVTQEDVDTGFVLNTALATGESPDGEDPEDETEIETPIDRNSAITITKVADVEAVQNEGEVINYTIVVTNSGNTSLTEVLVKDPLTGLEEVIGILNPGESVSFETSYTVTIEDIASKEAIVNVATATFTDPISEEEVTEEAEEVVPVECIDDTLATGIIFRDLNQNNTYEPELGETVLANVPVVLIPIAGTPGDALLVVTGADGRYTFKDFVPGTYTVQVRDVNLNLAQGLFPTGSSLAFPTIEACAPFIRNFGYEAYEGIVLGDFVWYDLNGDGIQNEWFDANEDGQVTLNDPNAGPIRAEDWEWFDLNGDGRYDGPENEGELNKAGFGVVENTSGNVRVTGPGGYDETIIVGIAGYWRTRPFEEDGKFAPPAGVNPYGEYTATLIEDDLMAAQASFMAATGKVKILPNAGGRITDINGTRVEERCGLTTESGITREVTPQVTQHYDMDFGWRCLNVDVEIIANDDDFGSHFISFGGVIGNILDNDRLEGQRPDPADVDFEFTELDGIIGLLINDNGELGLVPNVNEVRDYTLRYVLRETAFPDNNDDALVFFRILNDNVDLSVTKTSFEAEIYEGDEFEYEIVVSNVGGTPATGVTIVDNLPSGVTYLSSRVVSVSNPQIQVGTPTVSGSTVTWNVPFIPSDGVITLRIRVQAGDAGQIQNVVTVDSEEDDMNEQDNRDTDVNQVLPFRIPNVITPNGDGDNDTFEIKGLGKFTASEIVIFNRYGDHVLEKENYQNDWNAPGQVAGTYFYVLKLTDRSGRVHEFTGWIQVIKE